MGQASIDLSKGENCSFSLLQPAQTKCWAYIAYSSMDKAARS